ncbi:MAG: alpha-ketoglutarate-dependent dioxygenase AlkB [Rhodospirillaceae bacterium]
MPNPITFEDADAVLYPAALPDADELFRDLTDGIQWKQEILRLYGRRIPQPRLSAWYGDAAYAYSGLKLDPQPWHPVLADLRDRCGSMAGAPFNSVLANLYRDGRDSMDWHSDDEESLGHAPVIVSVNLGAARRFQLRRKAGTRDKIDMELGGGDMLIMRGQCQHAWQHRVPKTKKPVGPRINLTFRLIVGAAP